MADRPLPSNSRREEDLQLRRVLTTLLWAIGGLYIFVIGIALFYGDRVLMAVMLVAIALLSIPLALLGRHRLRASALAIVLIVLATLTSIATVGQGIRDMAVLGFPIILIFAALVLDRALLRLSVGLGVLAVCWLAVGETFGWFVTIPFQGGNTNWFYLLGVTLILLIAAFGVDLLASNIRRNLELARTEIAQRKGIEERLEEERILLRTLIDSLPDRIYAMDARGTKILSNTADWQAAGGKTMEDVVGKTDFDTYPHELAVQFWALDKQVIDSGVPVVGVEEPGLDPAGKPVMTLTSKVPLRNAQGQIVGLVGSGHDITQRKRSELIQDEIHRISQAAIGSEGIQELYRSIHSILTELIPAENFYIALYDAGKDSLSFPYFVDQYDERPTGPTKVEGLTGYVIRTGYPLLATREVLDRLVGRGEVQAVGPTGEDWMGAPLVAAGRTIGVVAMQSYVKGVHFSQADLNLLEFVSSQVAQAIERKRMEEEIRSLSLTDELTGLNNRRGFAILADQETKLAIRLKRNNVLLFSDMDSLKLINDTHGHAQGDRALTEVADVLKETFRESDILARFGGDEFVVLAVDVSVEAAATLVMRVRDALQTRNLLGERSYQLTLSMGMAPFDHAAPRPVSELIAEADGMMYVEKQAKKAARQA